MLNFFSESLNIFDFLVVSLSLVEVAVMVRIGGGTALTALRSFKTIRLLRVLKSFRVLRLLRMFRCACHGTTACSHFLARHSDQWTTCVRRNTLCCRRYLDSLRALGEVLMDSMDSFLAVSFLCALFLVVFTILGALALL